MLSPAPYFSPKKNNERHLNGSRPFYSTRHALILIYPKKAQLYLYVSCNMMILLSSKFVVLKRKGSGNYSLHTRFVPRWASRLNWWYTEHVALFVNIVKVHSHCFVCVEPNIKYLTECSLTSIPVPHLHLHIFRARYSAMYFIATMNREIIANGNIMNYLRGCHCFNHTDMFV